MTNWEPIVMAGLGAGFAALDPSLPTQQMVILCIKGFVGGAVGAYFGNHANTYRARRKARKQAGKEESG